MEHALKIERLDIKPKFADQVIETLKEFCSDLGYSNDRISDLECRSCDGFIPHSHNHGGVSCVAFRDQWYTNLEGTGFDNADATLEKYQGYNVDYYIADNPHLSKDRSTWSESDLESFDEYCQNGDDSVLFSLDIMHTGQENKTHSLNFRFCVCVKDSPYHRQYDDKFEFDIEFKTITELKAELAKILKAKDVDTFMDNLQEAY